MENNAIETVQEVTEVTEVVTQEEVQEDVQNLSSTTEELENAFLKRDEALNELREITKQLDKTNLTIALRHEGLDVFDGLFECETQEDKINFLKNAVNQILVNHSYKPKDVAKQEQYTQAIENGDVQKAIGFKLSNLFKK